MGYYINYIVYEGHSEIPIQSQFVVFQDIFQASFRTVLGYN